VDRAKQEYNLSVINNTLKDLPFSLYFVFFIFLISYDF